MNLKKIVLELNDLLENLTINNDEPYSYLHDKGKIRKIIDNLNEIIINEEHAKTMSAEIPLERLRNEKFIASNNALALAASVNVETMRRKIRNKDTVLELANGNYVCRTAETVIIKVNKG